jgi:hypothetical protein
MKNKKKINMKQIPFPHILTYPSERNENRFRVVSDQELVVGDRCFEAYQKMLNKKTELMEMTFTPYIIIEINEQRKARGDWSKWPAHPTYYDCKAIQQNICFESEIMEAA